MPAFENRTSENLTSKEHDLANTAPQYKLSVLVANDNEATRFLLESMLTGWDHAVSNVENRGLALKAAQNDRYNVILMDMQIPEIYGATATRKIRNLDSLRDCVGQHLSHVLHLVSSRPTELLSFLHRPSKA